MRGRCAPRLEYRGKGTIVRYVGSLRCRTNQSRLPCLAAVALVVAILSPIVASCGRKEATQQEKKEIFDTEVANDLSKIRRLLPTQGTPDFGKVSYSEFLDFAADKFAEVAGTPCPDQRIPVIAALSRHLRHITGKAVVVVGKIGVDLRASGISSFIVATTMKSNEGVTYQLGISTDETEYKNSNVNNQQFSVDFDSTYKIHGVIVDNVLEAEEVELLAGAHSGHGIVVPVSLLLASTEDIILLHLKQDQPALVLDAARNGNFADGQGPGQAQSRSDFQQRRAWCDAFVLGGLLWPQGRGGVPVGKWCRC
jgi:hypothetical protein